MMFLPQSHKVSEDRRSKIDHISICICTYKRPKMLAKLLSELKQQMTNNLFIYSIVVVDNDKNQSARNAVDSFKENKSITSKYYIEPEQNIARARNKAITQAEGNFIAFIDDDEFPIHNQWLLNLYRTLKNYKADGILGPVIPFFEAEPPSWIVRGKLFERKSFKTGSILRIIGEMRTGNVFFRRDIFEGTEEPFDPSFGKTGGEDTNFFKEMLAKKMDFRWCNEAGVFENIPLQRFTRSYLLKRALLRGVVNARHTSFLQWGTLKSIIAIVAYSLALPFLFVIGHHLFMKYLVRNCDHIGKLLSLCGIEIIKDRSFYGM